MKLDCHVQFTVGDLVVVSAALLTAALLFLIPWLLPTDGGAQLIVRVGDEESVYDLARDTSFTVENEGVVLTVVIENGEAYVKESDCRDGICENSARISKTGQSIVCAPGKISLSISSNKDEEGEDAVAG